jgi:hypothetical protein
VTNLTVSIANSTIVRNVADASLIVVDVTSCRHVVIELFQTHVALTSQLFSDTFARIFDISATNGAAEFVTCTAVDSELRLTVVGCVPTGGLAPIGQPTEGLPLCHNGPSRNSSDSTKGSLISFGGSYTVHRYLDVSLRNTSLHLDVAHILSTLRAFSTAIHFKSFSFSNISVAGATVTVVDAPLVNITANFIASLIFIDQLVGLEALNVSVLRASMMLQLTPLRAALEGGTAVQVIFVGPMQLNDVHILVDAVDVHGTMEHCIVNGSVVAQASLTLVALEVHRRLIHAAVIVANSRVIFTQNNISSTGSAIPSLGNVNIAAMGITVVEIGVKSSSRDEPTVLESADIVVTGVTLFASSRYFQLQNMDFATVTAAHAMVYCSMAEAIRISLEVRSSSLTSTVEMLASPSLSTSSRVEALVAIAVLSDVQFLVQQKVFSSAQPSQLPFLNLILSFLAGQRTRTDTLTLNLDNVTLVGRSPTPDRTLMSISAFVAPNNATASTFSASRIALSQPASEGQASVVSTALHAVICLADCALNTSTVIVLNFSNQLRGPLITVVRDPQSAPNTPVMRLVSTNVSLLDLQQNATIAQGSGYPYFAIWGSDQIVVVDVTSTLEIDGCIFSGLTGLFGRNVSWMTPPRGDAATQLNLGCNMINDSGGTTEGAANLRPMLPSMILRGTTLQRSRVAYPAQPFSSMSFPASYPPCPADVTALTPTRSISFSVPTLHASRDSSQAVESLADAVLGTVFSISLAVELIAMIGGGGDAGGVMGDAQMVVMLGQSSCAPSALRASTSTVKNIVVSPFSLWGNTAVALGNGALVACAVVVIHTSIRWTFQSRIVLFIRSPPTVKGGSDVKIYDGEVLQQRLGKAVHGAIAVITFFVVGMVNAGPKLFSGISDGGDFGGEALQWSAAALCTAVAVAVGHLYVVLTEKCKPHFRFHSYTASEVTVGLKWIWLTKHARVVRRRGLLPEGCWRPKHIKTAFGKLRGAIVGGKERFAAYPVILALLSGLISGIPVPSSWCVALLPLIAMVSISGAGIILVFRPNRCWLAGTFHAAVLLGTALTALLCTAAGQHSDDGLRNWASLSLPRLAMINGLVSMLRSLHSLFVFWFERNIQVTTNSGGDASSDQLLLPTTDARQRTTVVNDTEPLSALIQMICEHQRNGGL